MTTDHTRIWFKTQAVIDGIDDNYYLHHGNPSAESPPEDWANVYKVGDNFDDGTLTDTLTPSWAGAATVAETGGELVIDMGTNSGDAAIVSTPIDASKRFVLRHKVMYIGSTGTVDDLNIAAIVQNATQPVVTVNMTFNPTFRVYFYQDRTGSFIMQYIDSSRIAHRWNGSSWQTSSPAPWAYNGSIGTYYIAEIVSDGNQFYQVLRDGNGNVLTQTTPVLWDQVLDDGNPLWLVWGEPYTSHYWLDAKSDFFYLRDYVYPEPAVLVGEEDTLNTAPVAVADSYGTNEDALLSIPAPGVLANDTDADTNPLTAILVTGPSYAKSFTLNSNGSFAYAPNDNYYGPDSFSYKANDGSADSEPTTVTITITPVNDAPDAIDDTATVNEDSSMVIAVLANDTDVDGDLLSATSVSAPANGTAAINDGATITYTPNPNFCGLDSFTYSISDGNGGGDTATVTITVYCVNDPPVAVDDSYSTDEDTTLVVAVPGVLGNDSDIEGNTLTAVLVSAPTHGSSFALDSDGSFSYTPVLNFNGSDSFTYNVNDGLADSNTVTVTITVNAVNDAPRVSVSPTTQTVQYSDGIAPITITATDVDSFPLTATPSGLPPDVILTGSCTSDGTEGASCTWTIQGIADVPEGNYPVTITVSDGGVEGSVTENITITVIPEDAGVAFHEDNPVAVKVARGGGTAPSFDLYVDVFEIYPEPYGSPANSGDIRNAHLQVSLVPVGPGGGSGPITCTPYAVEEPTNYGRLTFVCNIPAGLAVNTYSLIAELVGGYYAGSAEDVLVVYDPSLGFVTGGGWFYWPGTEEGQVGNPDYYPGDKTNFGFTMRYNRRGTNVQGRLLLIRHLPDGMVLDCGGSPIYNMIYGVKSNALYGLALGQTGTYGRASFSGKATYLDPCMPKPEGNHEFIVYVEDLNEPGKGVDRFWIEVKDKDGNVITEMSMPLPAGHNAEEIQGGNIVVPHR
jgi:VCBS repeat-containing protein